MNLDLQKLLHHRKPYLLIDGILEHGPTAIHAFKKPTLEEFYLQGHFPGTPVVPGAMMQEMVTQAAGALIAEYHSPVPNYDSRISKGFALGVLRAVHSAKYKNFARPGDFLDVRAELLDSVANCFRFKGSIEREGTKIMQIEFSLINIEESKLRGF